MGGAWGDRRPPLVAVVAVGAASVVAAVVLLAAAPAAGAHAALVRSDPAAGAVMERPPPTVRLWFTEGVVPEATAVEVARSGGAPLETVVRTEPGRPELVVAELPARVADGVYIVRWSVLSADDGHLTRGVLAFGVGAGSDPSTVALDQPGAGELPENVALRWLNFVALTAVFGPLAVALSVVGGRRCRDLRGAGVADARRAAQGRLLAGAAVAATMAAAVGVVTAAWHIHDVTSGPGPGAATSARELLLDTRWGALWLARQVALIVGIACVVRLRRAVVVRRVLPPVSLTVGAVGSLITVAVTQALNGHAASVEPATELAVEAEAAHLIAAACWIGGLVALASLGPVRGTGPARLLNRTAWTSFGPLAAGCVAVLAVTGLYRMAGGVASLDAALRTTYGRALLAKSGLFVMMGLAGLCGAAALHPAVARRLGLVLRGPARRLTGSLRGLRRIVLLEIGVGAAILALAALASAIPPAVGPEFAPANPSAAGAQSATAGDVLVSLSAYPNRPGENLLRVRATSTRRGPPDDIDRVLARVATAEGDASVETVPLAAAADGTFEATTAVLGQAGDWRIEVVIRRAGVEDATAGFGWELPVANPQPRLVSDRPWSGMLRGVAAALGVLAIACASGFAVISRRAGGRSRQQEADDPRLRLGSVAGGGS